MMAQRRCWWCGHEALVDTSLPESNGLLRDDSRMDGGESWICAPNRMAECIRGLRQQAPEASGGPVPRLEGDNIVKSWRYKGP